MNNNLTELIVILDRSGSMARRENDVIGGFNQLMADRKNDEEDTKVSLVLFDTSYDLVYDRKDVRDIKDLTKNEYFVRGLTALYDAIGITIDSIGKRLAQTPEDKRPHRVVVAIMTDGMENASHDYSHSAITAMIKRQQEVYSWEFLFLGANIDSARTATSMGMSARMSVDFEANSYGIDKSFSYMTCVMADKSFKERSKLYDMDISNLDLSAHTSNVLKRCGIQKCVQLSSRTETMLADKGLTKKEINEVMNELKKYNLSLRKYNK